MDAAGPGVSLEPPALRAGNPATGIAEPGEAASLAYRADIDGLRAIAVISVVLHHLQIPGFSGGYAGVDIFFVISGFLITRIVHGQLQAGNFSLVLFYERRIRRIFPALFTVLATSVAVAWFVLPPPDIAMLGGSLAATAMLVSNLYFMEQGSYWTSAAQQSPLLHAWSLSVEEQFYLLFPWLLLACSAWLKSRYALCLGIVAACSYGVALVLETLSASAAFYFGGARAWELLLGAILAVAPVWGNRNVWVANACGLAGAAAVGVAVSGVLAGQVSPVVALLLPCLGAALLVWAGASGGLAGAALGARPLVFVGLISYSLYLWHWPVLVLYKAARPYEAGTAALVLLMSFVLAVVSWHVVEQPFRRWVLPRTRVFWMAGAGVALLLACAVFLHVSAGGAWRVSPRLQWLYSFDHYDAKDAAREQRCFLAPGRRDPSFFDGEACLPRVAGKPSYLLVGDSHAAHLWLGLVQALPEGSVQQATASGCRPLGFGPRDPQCEPFLDHMFKTVIPSTRPQAVILSARWGETDIEPLRRTVQALLQSTPVVIVLGPAVEYQERLPRLLAAAERSGDAFVVERARVPETAQLDEKISAALKDSGAGYVSIYRLLCPPDGSSCITATPGSGVPVQFDYGHFTREGAIYVAQALRDQLLSALVGPTPDASRNR